MINSDKSTTVSQPSYTDLHAKYLADRFVREEEAWAAGVRSLSPHDWEVLKKHSLYPGLPCYPMGGLLVEYQATLDGLRHARVKPDHRTYPKDKSPGQNDPTAEVHETPRWVSDNQGVVPYLPPWTLEARKDVSIPIFLVEAPIKAISLRRVGAHAVGLGGVLAGAHDKDADELEAHPELKRLKWAGRRAFVAYDAGRVSNPSVALGEARTASVLRGLGAEVRLVQLPLREPDDETLDDLFEGKDQGPDDYLAGVAKAGGEEAAKEAWEGLVRAAVPSDPVEWLEEALAESAEPRQVVRGLLRSLPWLAALQVGGKEAQGLACRAGRKAGLTKESLAEALKKFSKELGKKLEKDNPPLERGDEAELADLVLQGLGGKDRVVYDAGHVHAQTEEGLWKKVSEEAIVTRVKGFAGKDVRFGERIIPLKIQSKTCHGAAALVRAESTNEGFFDMAPHGLAFRNGFLEVDLRTRTSSWHDKVLPRHRARTRIDADYKPGLVPTKILAFLEQVFAGEERDAKVQAFREVAGAGILGVGTHFAKALVLLGNGSDGKSVLCNLLERSVGREAASSVKPQDLEEPYFLAALAGKSLNLVSDVPEKTLLTTGQLKAAISGDKLTAREPGFKPFDFRPRATHVFAMNSLPATNDYSYGFRRRWLILRCPNSVTGAEVDPFFFETLLEEVPAFVAWLVDGALEAVSRKAYTTPIESEEVVAEWTRDSDPVATFVAARVRVLSPEQVGDASAWTRASSLYEDYRAWCEENGHARPVTATTFGRRIKDLLKVEKNHRKNGDYYPLSIQTEGFADDLDSAAIESLLERQQLPALPPANQARLLTLRAAKVRVGTADGADSDLLGRVSGLGPEGAVTLPLAAGVLANLERQPPGAGKALEVGDLEVEVVGGAVTSLRRAG